MVRFFIRLHVNGEFADGSCEERIVGTKLSGSDEEGDVERVWEGHFVVDVSLEPDGRR